MGEVRAAPYRSRPTRDGNPARRTIRQVAARAKAGREDRAWALEAAGRSRAPAWGSAAAEKQGEALVEGRRGARAFQRGLRDSAGQDTFVLRCTRGGPRAAQGTASGAGACRKPKRRCAIFRQRARRRVQPQGIASRRSAHTAARKVRAQEFPQQIERRPGQAEEVLPRAERSFLRASEARDRLPPECARDWLPDQPRSGCLSYGNEKTKTSPHNSPWAMSSRSLDYAMIRVAPEFPFGILPRKLW